MGGWAENKHNQGQEPYYILTDCCQRDLDVGLFAGGWINEYFGWRIAFFVVGIPGILLAIIFRFTVQEPKRGQAEGRADIKEQPSIIETAKYLLSKKSFRHLAFGASLAAFVGYGAMTWLPSFFQIVCFLL